MQLEISLEEARFLKQQLRRHLSEMENELVHTDKHELQHALAQDLERMRKLELRLEVLIAQGEAAT